MMTFDKLIKDYKIVIPKIQRDYAQGRAKYNKNGEEVTSEKPYQVRTGLVNALFERVSESGKVLDLNFVYGKKCVVDNRNVFIPIDGQQRLTTLFLFHLYVYQRAGLIEEIKKLGDSFSYASRDTTKAFCIELCKNTFWENNDDERIQQLSKVPQSKRQQYLLSTKISDKIWFTSSYANDPSVRSMLNMIDAIEAKFVSSGKYQCKEDFLPIVEKLQADSCPIRFSYLDVQDFDDEDMYIKMNARGKELTDFEIFKARLEEGDALSEVCYVSSDTPNEKTRKISQFIGKYNNEFVNLFYSMQEIGKESYDTAFFNFVECFIKLDHFAYLTSRTKVSEELYYNDFSITNYTGASLYNDYVLNPSLHGYKKDDADLYVEELRKRAKDSIKKITAILRFFVSNGFECFPEYKNDLEDNIVSYNESKLVCSNVKKASTLVLVTQYALFSFLYMLECDVEFKSKRDAYGEWKRFVCNITYRFSIKDPVNFAKMAGVFDSLLHEIKCVYDKNGAVSNRDILQVIKEYNSIPAITDMPIASIRHLFDSEARKAILMLDPKDGDVWDKYIRKAEEYYFDGNLDFLFEIIDNQSDPEMFLDAYKKSVEWIGQNKEPKDTVAFNEAMLCMEYPAEYKEIAHLRQYNSGWQLFWSCNLRESLNDLLKENNKNIKWGIEKLFEQYNLSSSPRENAECLVASYTPQDNSWLRNTLVKERLVAKLFEYRTKWKFSGAIGRWNHAVADEYVLFYSTGYNSNNLELNTFRLAMRVIEKHPELYINVISGRFRNIEDRYIQVGSKKVSYDIEHHCFYNIDRQEYFSANNDCGMSEAEKYLDNPV